MNINACDMFAGHTFARNLNRLSITPIQHLLTKFLVFFTINNKINTMHANSQESSEMGCGNLESDAKLGPISRLCTSANQLKKHLLTYELDAGVRYNTLKATRQAIVDAVNTKKSKNPADIDNFENLEQHHKFIKSKIRRLYTGAEALKKAIDSGEALNSKELDVMRVPILEDSAKLSALIRSLEVEIEDALSRTQNELSKNLPALSIREKQLSIDARTMHIESIAKEKQTSAQFEDMVEELQIIRFQEDTQPENMILAISNTLNSIHSIGHRIFVKKMFLPFTEPIQELQISARNVNNQSSRLESLKQEMRSELTEVSMIISNAGDLKIEAAKVTSPDKESSTHMTGSEIAKSLAHISQPPVIEIFQLKPPFVLTLSDLSTVQTAQNRVAREYALFRQPAATSLRSECSITKFTELNNWQRFLYHYFNPFQENVPGMLVAASAGAGKSWAIATLASTWGRAGHRVSVATKENIIDDIHEAMFRCYADLNINNLVNGFGIDLSKDSNVKIEKVKSAEKSSTKSKAPPSMKTRGFDLLKDMGVSWIHSLSGKGVWSLTKLNNLIAADWPTHKKKGGPADFPLEGAMLQFDEAHRLITPQQELKSNEVPNYKLLLMELFKHRKDRPVSKWPRVVLHTATPVASAPVDPIRLLNLLVDRKSAWIDFMFENPTAAELLANPDALGEELNSVETNYRFLRDYVNEDGTLNAKGAKKWDTLAAGKISYVSMYGDRNHFPQPDFPMTVVTEELSEKQTNNILCCLGYKKTNCLAAISIEDEDGGDDDDNEIRELSAGTKANASTKATKQKSKKSDKKSSRADNSIKSPFEKKTECALKQAINPRTEVKGITKIPWIERAKKYAPNVIHLMDEMISGVRKEQVRYSSIRSNAYATGRSIPVDMPFNSKIFLYIAHPCREKAATNMVYGILDENKFECLNPKDKPFRTDIPPYRAYINHTRGDLGEGKSKELRDYYNSKENADGKLALIFCSSSRYREGISLFNVKKVYIAGTEDSEANLVQAVARAVRFCSHDKSLWDPLKGWTLQVYLQRLVWYKALKEDPTSTIKLQESFNKMLQAVNPNGMKFYRCLNQMTRLVGVSGVDMGLFGSLNSSGNDKDGKNKIRLP